MASTGLDGPYVLDHNTINRVVTKESPGACALGRYDDNTFYVRYVGRSDVDVTDRLADHVGKYSHFKFRYYSTAKATFEKECHLWHDFGGDKDRLDNKNHPARPDGASWLCPRCTIFHRLAVRR